jgi:hypothetical protein
MEANITVTPENVKEEPVRTHRVGTMTLGLTLISFGALYLARLFTPAIPIDMIMHAWPIPMILLGLELLFAGFSKRKFIIDKGAIVLCFLVILFVFGMACADFMMEWFMKAAEAHLISF